MSQTVGSTTTIYPNKFYSITSTTNGGTTYAASTVTTNTARRSRSPAFHTSWCINRKAEDCNCRRRSRSTGSGTRHQRTLDAHGTYSRVARGEMADAERALLGYDVCATVVTLPGGEGIMWGRVLAASGGLIILVFTIALWYSDHQKNMSIIANWQKDYNSLLTDRGNVNIRNVQLIRQNRQLVANNGILTEEKQQLSDSLTDLYQKIDTLSVQIDQLQQASELADITSSDLEKQSKINKNLLDESARLSQELERCAPH